MKCRYKYCLHGGEEVSKDEAIKIDKMYFHPDCYREWDNTNQLINVYLELVDPNPIWSKLRKIINDIIVNKKVDSGFMLFGLRYCMEHGWKLTNPAGLYYVADSKEAKEAWEKKRNAEDELKLKNEFKKIEPSKEETQFDYRQEINRGFESILRQNR